LLLILTNPTFGGTVKRRICLVGAALCVVPLASGVAAAGAAHTSSAGTAIKIKCASDLGLVIASGDTGVTPPVQSGTEYGPVACGKLGSGVQKDTFNVPDSGDTIANYRLYFPTGTIHGRFDLAAQEGSFGSGFTGTDYLGTMTVSGGTGAFAGAKGKGTMKCSTADGIHTTCIDHLKLKQF
jgi:hypothetical protein